MAAEHYFGDSQTSSKSNKKKSLEKVGSETHVSKHFIAHNVL